MRRDATMAPLATEPLLPPESTAPSLLPSPIAEVVRRLAPLILAAATWVSLSPYFVWGSVQGTFYASVVATLVAVACVAGGARPKWRSVEVVGVALVSLFLVYITLEPRLDGGHTRWIYVVPTLVALTLLSSNQRVRCLNAFAAIFALSLVPGILDSVWVAAGLPQTFGVAPVPNAAMAAQGVRFLTAPGVRFIESNSVLLPWGGVLFRLSGIYDEPGTVGTNAALLLIALRLRISDWRTLLLYLGGILSFSLAFAVIASGGILANAVLRRRPVIIVAILPILAAASMALGWIHISTPSAIQSNILIVEPTQQPGPTPGLQSPSPTPALSNPSSTPTPAQQTTATPTARPPQRFTPNGPGLRQTKVIDNRSLAAMNVLFNEWRHSGVKTLLLGIASDASVVRGGASEVWTRVLTDHGILGFVLLFTGVALLGLEAFRRSGYALPSLVFLVLYAVNIYQRPVVWLPYALLLLICGPVRASISDQTDHDRNAGASRVEVPRLSLLV